MSIIAENLVVELGGAQILSGVSMSARRGEVVTLVGPNGSGKTTVLKVLAGVLRRFAGRVEVLGGPPRPDKVAFVAQVPELQFTERTVLEELASVFRARGAGWREALRRARQLLRESNLEHLSDRVVYELSQGEKRLISFLEMDALGREVYLLDEPTFGLDMRYSMLVVDRVRKLSEAGKTVVLVTHDSWVLPLLRARIYGLSRGRVVFEGDLVDLLRRRDLWPELGFAPPKFIEELAQEEGLERAVEEYAARVTCAWSGCAPTR